MADTADAARILESTVKVWEILAYLQDDRYMTQRTASAYIDHKDTRKIEAAIRAGQLRAFRIGKKILVKKSDIDAWLEAHEVTRQKKAERSELGKLVDVAIARAKGAA